jgi:hypothetical protein
MTKRIFKAGKGSTFDDEKAQKYGEFLWKLKEENGDVLTSAQIVEKAKPKNSPIHDFFEWDNDTAGEKYRLSQARYLIARIEIIVVSDGEEDQIRAFHNISIQEGEEHDRGYVTVRDLQINKDYLEIVLSNAHSEIISWEKRYSQYKRLKVFKPLKPIFKAIKQAVSVREARI